MISRLSATPTGKYDDTNIAKGLFRGKACIKVHVLTCHGQVSDCSIRSIGWAGYIHGALIVPREQRTGLNTCRECRARWDGVHDAAEYCLRSVPGMLIFC